jgi:hypothetical protein
MALPGKKLKLLIEGNVYSSEKKLPVMYVSLRFEIYFPTCRPKGMTILPNNESPSTPVPTV